MCDLLTGMMILGGASSLVSAGGALKAGSDEETAGDYNAAVARQSAVATEEKTAFEVEAHREKVRKLLSSQRAAFAVAGVDMEGSPLLVLEDTAAQGELDAKAIQYSGDVEASQKRSQAELYELQGKNAKTSSYWKAGSSLLSGGGTIAKQYYDSKRIYPYYKEE